MSPVTEPQPEPRDHLIYHYTSTEALAKIVKSQEFHCTRLDYCNDSKEGRVYPHLVNRALMYADLSEDSHQNYVLRSLRGWLSREASERERLGIFPYIACFSLRDDSLSQWRAYAARAQTLGCAIGIDWRLLREKALTPLRPVEYVGKDDESTMLLRIAEGLGFTPSPDLQDVTQDVVPGMDSPPEGSTEAERMDHFYLAKDIYQDANGWMNDINSDAAVFKDASFRDEEEWRLIIEPVPEDRIKYRPSRFGFTPYVVAALPEIKEMIRAIRVGPTPHTELATKAVRAWAHKEISSEVEVLPSNTPFFDW